MKNKRIIEIGAMTTQVAVKELERLATGIFLSKEKKEKKDLEAQEKIAEIIFSKLSQLKGTGLKVLQVLSLDEELLPKPYIKKFESAYGQVSALSRPIVRKVFHNELKRFPEDAFSSFDYNCLAAASLGQVHEAVLKTGEKVVVKIQYPNVADNMKTEMKFIKTMAGTFGNALMKKSIEELASGLLAETNYELEAQNIDYFRKIEINNNIILPEVVTDFSSKKVLTLSYVKGKPLNQVKIQRLKNESLQRVFDFFFCCLKKQACIHADPHPGNILVSEESTGIIDFGSVKKELPDEVVELFLLLVSTNSSRSRIIDLYEFLGASITKKRDDFFQDHVHEYWQLCTSLVGKNKIDFSSKRAQISQMRRILFLQSREPQLQGLSSEFTFLHKAFQSLLFMFCKYDAALSTELE